MAGDSGQQPNKRRGPGRPFVKGQSGNPAGGPKGLAEMRAAFRNMTTDALAVASRWMNCGEGELELRAAALVLDRGWGKAAQPMTGEGGEGAAVPLVVFLPEKKSA